MVKVSRQSDGSPEIFYSVQGEGLNLGKPAVFLRLTLCNLACNWCDTRYTWDWQQYDREEQTLDITTGEIQQQILGHRCNYLVVTGGEPLLQQKHLLPVLFYLKERSFYVEIETNGTILPETELADLVDHWSVAPKLRNSGNSHPLREIPPVYQYFSSLDNSHFKYTIVDEGDFGEVQDIMRKYGMAPERIYLMPEARDRKSLLEKSGWLVELCKKQGCLFSTRLQVLLWGDRRGV